ncbi:Fe(3+)-pyochelin receptor [Oceanococcus atlanticus]|uniref:Fe(3+)-pyochelin receptor n=2 Tax=Oceanococcus atlanticus TaxID=1317117 RepID=A0A1Y1SI24_9GAMM|nr:Fe(3+)-pyochelin receptor [Oceanococcus atlanticus]
MINALRGPLATLMLLLCSAAFAQVFDLRIDAGALDSALIELATQTDVQLIVDVGLLANHDVLALSGRYSLSQALTELLSGTDLMFEIADHTVRIGPGPEPLAAIGTVEIVAGVLDGVGASSDILATEQLVNYAAPGASLGGFGATRLRDIPRAVSVMTQQRMRDQHIVDVADALDRLPGLSLDERTLDRTIAHGRAFPLEDIQLDGGGLLHSFDNLLEGDLSAYDRVELLRGSDGVGIGYAGPGGLLNLVRKRPLDSPQLGIQAGMGSWSFRDVTIDVTGPLTRSRRLRGRSVLSMTSKDYFYATSDLSRQSLYLVAEADVAQGVLARSGVQWLRQRATPWPDEGFGGQELDQAELSRAQSLTLPWQFDDRNSRTLFAALDAHLLDVWFIELRADQVVTDTDELSASLVGYLDGESGDGLEFAYPMQIIGDRRQNLVRIQVKRLFELWGLEHALVLSSGRSREQLEDVVYADNGEYSEPFNLFEFQPSEIPRPSVDQLVDRYTSTLNRENVTLALSLKLWPRFELTSAWRWNKISSARGLGQQSFERDEDHHDALSYVALNAELTQKWSAFASTADVYSSNMGMHTESGNIPKPSTGRSFDVGLKFAALDDRAQAMLSWYRVELNHPHRYIGSSQDDPSCCYDSGADYRILSQGLDFEFAGRLGSRWRIATNYQFNRNWFAGADVYEHGATANKSVPKHLFKSWLNWSSRRWPLELGVGLHAQSRSNQFHIFQMSAEGQLIRTAMSQPGYARVDGRLHWAVSRGWSVSMNVENILDRHYFVAREFDFGSNLYGEPRRYRVSVRARW